MQSNWRSTNWKYSTSEDTTGSIFLSFSAGTIVLQNVISQDIMRVKYKCLSASLSHGLPIGLSQSTFQNQSSGSNVSSLGFFDENVFPCGGYILSKGWTLGVFDSETGPPDPAFANGSTDALVVFGELPYARVVCRGGYAASTPGFGVGFGLSWFSLERPSA